MSLKVLTREATSCFSLLRAHCSELLSREINPVVTKFVGMEIKRQRQWLFRTYSQQVQTADYRGDHQERQVKGHLENADVSQEKGPQEA